MFDCVAAELKKVKDKELIAYVGARLVNNYIKTLFDACVETNPNPAKRDGIGERADMLKYSLLSL